MASTMTTATDRFLELSSEGLDADDQSVDLFLQLHAHAMIFVSHHSQLVQGSLQLAVVGAALATTALLNLQLSLQVTQLYTTRGYSE